MMSVMARAATTADAFNAVAEPRRRQILDALADGERPVNDLAALLGQAQPLVTTLTLTETGGGTTLTLLVQHASQENRDRHLEYGDSLQQAMDRLEQAAISLR